MTTWVRTVLGDVRDDLAHFTSRSDTFLNRAVEIESIFFRYVLQCLPILYERYSAAKIKTPLSQEDPSALTGSPHNDSDDEYSQHISFPQHQYWSLDRLVIRRGTKVSFSSQNTSGNPYVEENLGTDKPFSRDAMGVDSMTVKNLTRDRTVFFAGSGFFFPKVPCNGIA
eukprot:Rmarinus@m.125